MKVFQPTFKNKAGKKRKVQGWYVGFTDNGRIRRRLPAFTSKAATERAGVMIGELLGAAGGLPAHVAKWLEEIPVAMRDRLVKWDVICNRRWSVDFGTSLAEHLADYIAGKKADGREARYIKQTESQIRHILDGCKLRVWGDITANEIKVFLAKERDRGDYGQRAYNAYLVSIKCFAKWLIEAGRVSGNPLKGILCPLVKQTEFKKTRRALTFGEMGRLWAATEQAPFRFKMSGHARFLLYKLLLESGLRLCETQTLTVKALDFTADPPTIHIQGKDTKSKRSDDVFITPATAVLLREFVKDKGPQDLVFTMPHPANVAKMVRADLADAGIDYTDAWGRDLDGHAMKKTFTTNLVRLGAHPKVCQKMSRHADMKTTMGYYVDELHETEVGIAKKLADLSLACQNDAQSRTLADAGGQGKADDESKTALSA